MKINFKLLSAISLAIALIVSPALADTSQRPVSTFAKNNSTDEEIRREQEEAQKKKQQEKDEAEKRAAEEARIAEEQRRREEETRRAEEAGRKAEEARRKQEEARRKAEENRIKEEARIAAEVRRQKKIAEQERLKAAARKAAEEVKRQAATKKKKQEEERRKLAAEQRRRALEARQATITEKRKGWQTRTRKKKKQTSITPKRHSTLHNHYAKWVSSYYAGGSIGRISTDDESGSSIGVFAGRNWKNDKYVYGIEGEISNSDADGTTASGLHFDANWMVSVRGRAGYLVRPDTLLYATGGIAFANFDLRIDRSRTSKTLTGFIVGAGVEHKFDSNWAARLEYTYTAFGSENVQNTSFDPDTHAFRVSVVYHF